TAPLAGRGHPRARARARAGRGCAGLAGGDRVAGGAGVRCVLVVGGWPVGARSGLCGRRDGGARGVGIEAALRVVSALVKRRKEEPTPARAGVHRYTSEVVAAVYGAGGRVVHSVVMALVAGTGVTDEVGLGIR